MEWGPDGEKIVTATTAPRLRIGNGFKVWHYSGALLHETIWPAGQELLQTVWQKYPDGVFTEKPISNVKVAGIQPSQPQSSKAVYVPPNIRSGGAAPVGTSPRTANNQQPTPERGPIPGLPIGYKTSQGQRKKDRKTKRKESENVNQNANSNTSTQTIEERNATKAQNQSTPTTNNKRIQRRQPDNQNQTNGTNSNGNASVNANANDNANANNANASPPNEQANTDRAETREMRREKRRRNRQAVFSTFLGLPEKEKRMRIVQQKLRDIVKLKVRRDNGDSLHVDQLSKIGLEVELIKELNSLKVED